MVKPGFYTKVAGVVAGLTFILGALGVVIGLSVATGATPEPEPGYYLGGKSSGQAIDRGIYYMVIAVLIGVLSEISESLYSQRSKDLPEAEPRHTAV